MGISSLGVGSSILTQDVLDQLRAADEAKFVAPVESRISDENAKSTAFEQVDALMENAYESLKSLTEYGVFEARTTSVDDEDLVSVSASENSDIQDFTLEISKLATKEIEQSGSFTSRTDNISTGSGSMELKVGDETYTIDYEADTTLEGLKELIEKEAGESVGATIVQVGDGDFRLLFSAENTGTNQDISITDNGTTLNTALTSGMTNVQTAVDAEFKFNGLDITRSTNTIDDLLDGVSITLKDVGTTDVSVKQDRDHIAERITNFVDKYNSAMYQLNEDTKSSENADERGVFSSDSTIKNMKSTLQNILFTVGGDGGRLQEFGIEIDDDGRLELDSTVLNEQLDKNPENVHSYFIGGTFTKEDGSTVELEGAFTELEDSFARYSKGSAILDKYNESIETRLDSLNEQKESAVERLNSSYAIMQKRFAAYDSIISRYNTASNMFTQMIDAEIAANN